MNKQTNTNTEAVKTKRPYNRRVSVKARAPIVSRNASNLNDVLNGFMRLSNADATWFLDIATTINSKVN